MSANNSTPSAIIGKPKKLAKKLAPGKLTPATAGETSFVAELAVVTRHEDLDYSMQDAPDSVEVAITDPDTVMEDAPALEIELDVAELDSVEVAITVEDPDTVMEDAPALEIELQVDVAELDGSVDIIIDYS